jgi:UDP-N-acetylglucosamine transferase subunit ALG13
VIFVTCGSTILGFDRMMSALTALPAADLHVQHGTAEPPACAQAYAFLPFWTILQKMQEADVVVSHAGVGSIMCAVRAGHTPVIFPRLKRYSETVDDHQAELATALAKRGTAVVAWSADDLASAVASVPARRPATDTSATRLATAVRAAVRGESLPETALGSGRQRRGLTVVRHSCR